MFTFLRLPWSLPKPWGLGLDTSSPDGALLVPPQVISGSGYGQLLDCRARVRQSRDTVESHSLFHLISNFSELTVCQAISWGAVDFKQLAYREVTVLGLWNQSWPAPWALEC